MCARPDRLTYTRWVALLLLLLLACASMTGCLGPGLEPPDGDQATGRDPEAGADGGGVGVNPPGASGSGGRGSSAGGSGGAAAPAGGTSGSAGMQPGSGDAGEMGDAGIDDEDAGATR